MKVLHCSLVQTVNEKACVVVTLPSIEEAEALCLHWNNFMFKDRTVLKAHIHPFSRWKRVETIKSRHSIFGKLYVPGETPI